MINFNFRHHPNGDVMQLSLKDYKSKFDPETMIPKELLDGGDNYRGPEKDGVWDVIEEANKVLSKPVPIPGRDSDTDDDSVIHFNDDENDFSVEPSVQGDVDPSYQGDDPNDSDYDGGDGGDVISPVTPRKSQRISASNRLFTKEQRIMVKKWKDRYKHQYPEEK